MAKGRCFAKTHVLVERAGRFHFIDGVQKYAGILGHPRSIQGGFDQLTSKAQAAKSGANIKSFHFARIRKVRQVQRPHCATSGNFAIDEREEQDALWLGEFARQRFGPASRFIFTHGAGQ